MFPLIRLYKYMSTFKREAY